MCKQFGDFRIMFILCNNVPESMNTETKAVCMTDVSALELLKFDIISVKIVPNEYARPLYKSDIK